jgi:hypothetical protein
MSPEHRVAELQRRLARLNTAAPIRFRFIPSHETNFISYFADDYSADMAQLSASGFEQLNTTDADNNCDVIILTAHGSDLSTDILNLRARYPGAILVGWFWDNHLGDVTNLRTALMLDVIFPSHRYAGLSIANPFSLIAQWIPSCSAQWSSKVASAGFASPPLAGRSSKMLVNYVDYKFSWRTQLINALAVEAPEAEVKLMTPDNRTRYFAKSPVERFGEWLDYKASLILPVDRDLSTRLFDALLAGQVVVVSDRVVDLPSLIPPEAQAELGIISLTDLTVPSVRAAAIEAARRFDVEGLNGALRRHTFVLQNHMLVHRIGAILQSVRNLAVGTSKWSFVANGQIPTGLYQVA